MSGNQGMIRYNRNESRFEYWVNSQCEGFSIVLLRLLDCYPEALVSEDVWDIAYIWTM